MLTVLFEFGFGHYVTRDSWAALLGAYNLAEGRAWAAVPLWTAVGPDSSEGSIVAGDLDI